jgi:hypothetical protein
MFCGAANHASRFGHADPEPGDTITTDHRAGGLSPIPSANKPDHRNFHA